MYDVIIIGAGPAGLMCYAQLHKKCKALLIEKNKTSGKKLMLSGGGRCNVTNDKDSKAFLEEIKHNKKYLYSTIHKFGPKQIMQFFSETIQLKVEEEGRVFPKSDQAKDIVDFLQKDLNINFNENVTCIQKKELGYRVITQNSFYDTKKVVIATGGASFSKTGSNGDHMRFAKELNQPTIPLYPVETSVILKHVPDLAGASFNEVEVKAKKHKVKGNLMYTHKGLSGSAILKISEYVHTQKIEQLIIDLLPSITEDGILAMFEKQKESQMSSVLAKLINKRYAYYILEVLGVTPQVKVKQLSPKQWKKVVELLKAQVVVIAGSAPLETAFVSGGGIDVKGLDTKTFESKMHLGLYFIGECIDLHGPIGGYNITIALSTGYSAAQAIIELL